VLASFPVAPRVPIAYKDGYEHSFDRLAQNRLTNGYRLAVDEGTQAGVAYLVNRKTVLFGENKNRG